MIRILIAPIALAIALCLSAPETSAQDRVVDRLPVLADTVHFTHESERLGRPFEVFIKQSDLAPESGPLPIIYVLDADQSFPLIAAYSWAMTLSEEMEPAIIVGIGYGATNFPPNMRGTDYTAPGTSAHYGGAAEFTRVLETEIFPKVESMTRADPAQRVLVGQSIGGQFVIYTALNRPGLVDLGIAINPALHRNLPLFLEMLDAAEDGEARQSLYISSAENDGARFRWPALQFISAVNQRENLPLKVKTENLADHTHLSSMPRAFRNAVRWYLAD